MMCDVGVDAESGIVDTALSTHAKEPDISMLPALLYGEEVEVLGDRRDCLEVDRGVAFLPSPFLGESRRNSGTRIPILSLVLVRQK